MKEWLIVGDRELSGTIKVGGAKNSLLAILPAAILTRSIVYLSNIPPLKDTYMMINILKRLNVRIVYDNKSKLIVDTRDVKNETLDIEEMQQLRASYYFMGALLSLYKKVKVIAPGGCKFASRPIDLHLKAFNDLGIKYNRENDLYKFEKNKIINRNVKFKKVSVGATINAILASCRVKGNIRLINVAKEPEIDDLIAFLNKCGANIKRDNNDILIKGVSKLCGCSYRVMEDRIEAGTYLIIGACLGNNLKIEYHHSQHLKSLIDLFKKLNIDLKVKDNYIMISKCKSIEDINLIFDVYPSLPTDLQQPLSILLSKTKVCSVLKDKVYPSRYTQIEDLNNMGFKMEVKEDALYVYRSMEIKASEVSCKDLRGGASLVIASLLAKGKSKISGVEHILRGYYDILNKLKRVGAIVYEKD